MQTFKTLAFIARAVEGWNVKPDCAPAWELPLFFAFGAFVALLGVLI